jgi:hypothetical protein
VSAIKNFGDFWDRDKIYWGSQSPGDKGHLKGYLVGSKQTVVDFRPQIAIYVLYDSNMNIVYVGQTGSGVNDRLFHRLKHHKDGRARNRWKYFTWFGLRQATSGGRLHEGQTHKSKPHLANNAAALDEIEFSLLRVVEPKLNLSGGNWKALKIKQYVQWFQDQDEDTTFAEKEDIREVISRIKQIEKKLA